MTVLALFARAKLAADAHGRIFSDIAAVPSEPVAIVFGAFVSPSGVLSPGLQARVDAGLALYRAGKVRKILMTGDNGSFHYDEVTPMKNYAVQNGVPARDVVRDYAGFRTLDSCYRAKMIFQVDRAILVTQAFHLPRCLYLARHAGIEAVGYTAQDTFSRTELDSVKRRELYASLEAMLDVAIGRAPRFLGQPEPIIGDNRSNR